MRRRADSLWAVILAAGDGSRLVSLTSALYGCDLPKQFASIDGRRSLMQMTVERVTGLVAPHRIVVVIGESHETLACAQLARYPGVEVLVQPRNIGTGPGVLLPLAWVLRRDSSAAVAVFPSDHYIPNPAPFLRAVEDGLAAVRAHPELITILGVAPDRAETDYGWVLPGPRMSGSTHSRIHLVRRFIEKPSPQVARWLLEHHALWNTFTLVGRAAAYWGLARQCLTQHTLLFERHMDSLGGQDEKAAMAALYQELPPADFSHAILERAPGLAAIPVEDSGWCDWGRPERVTRSLAGTALLEQLHRRMGWGRSGGDPIPGWAQGGATALLCAPSPAARAHSH
jgi:mannose-1-phosphate guanylyltransferase